MRLVRQTGGFPLVRSVTSGRQRRPVLTWADRLTLYGLVGLGVGLLLVPAGGSNATGAAVTGTDGFRLDVALTKEGRYEVPGPLGATVVAVRNGAVMVESSPCPQQVCVDMGAAARPGEVIACVPNGVVVRVLGGDSPLDATTR